MAKLIYSVEHLYKNNNVKTTMFSDIKKAQDFADKYKGIVWQKLYVGNEHEKEKDK